MHVSELFSVVVGFAILSHTGKCEINTHIQEIQTTTTQTVQVCYILVLLATALIDILEKH
jgi:peptidoglycan biosynthesis protein MviN/MurJ (putative lipid II flippase)